MCDYCSADAYIISCSMGSVAQEEHERRKNERMEEEEKKTIWWDKIKLYGYVTPYVCYMRFGCIFLIKVALSCARLLSGQACEHTKRHLSVKIYLGVNARSSASDTQPPWNPS